MYTSSLIAINGRSGKDHLRKSAVDDYIFRSSERIKEGIDDKKGLCLGRRAEPAGREAG
jgi:hypothetical protein